MKSYHERALTSVYVSFKKNVDSAELAAILVEKHIITKNDEREVLKNSVGLDRPEDERILEENPVQIITRRRVRKAAEASVLHEKIKRGGNSAFEIAVAAMEKSAREAMRELAKELRTKEEEFYLKEFSVELEREGAYR